MEFIFWNITEDAEPSFTVSNHSVSDTQDDVEPTSCTVASVFYGEPQDIGISILLLLITIITIIGNAAIVLILRLSPRMHTPLNVYYTSLASADMLVGLVVMPLVIVQTVTQCWPFGQVTCMVFILGDFLYCEASYFTLLAVTFDRYMAVAKPLTHRRYSTVRSAKVVVILIWIGTAIVYFPVVLVVKLGESSVVDFCTFVPSPTVTLTLIILLNYLPLVGTVSLFILTFLKIHRSSNTYMETDYTRVSFRRQDVEPKFIVTTTGTKARSHSDVSRLVHMDVPVTSEYFRDTLARSATVQGLDNITKEVTLFSDSRRENGVMKRGHESTISINGLTHAHTCKIHNGYNGFRANTVQNGCGTRKPQEPRNIKNMSDRSLSPATSQRFCAKIATSSRRFSNEKDKRIESHDIVTVYKNRQYCTTTVTQPPTAGGAAKGDFAHRSPRHQSCRRHMRVEHRARRMLGLLLGALLVCWLPWLVMWPLMAFQQNNIPIWLAKLAAWLTYVNSTINPALYMFSNREFLNAARSLWQRMTRQNGHRRFSQDHYRPPNISSSSKAKDDDSLKRRHNSCS